jgi:hypothetical protein
MTSRDPDPIRRINQKRGTLTREPVLQHQQGNSRLGIVADAPEKSSRKVEEIGQSDPVRFSGRYVWRSDGADRLAAVGPGADANASGHAAPARVVSSRGYLPSFTLNVDIDGPDPLNVVSGTFGMDERLTDLDHLYCFVGRVRRNEPSRTGRVLVVEDFAVPWPGSTARINRLELSLDHSVSTGTRAEVIFRDTLQNLVYGPFSAIQESPWFRQVEMDVAVEVGAAEVEPYNTHTHPDRPANLPEEILTIASAFAKAGIHIIRSPENDQIIDKSEAGEDGRWSMMELHDSMQLHWDAFASRPKWRLWLFLACLSEHERMGATMFDGLGRQGVAIFTRCQYFHSINGGYIVMNPPLEAAVKRELFFNTIHEMGHAFNLSHPSERTGRPWKGPPWMRCRSSKRAVTWMNYPDFPTRHISGANATWFYKRFAFQFDKHDLLFVRHAPDPCVAMGREAWFHNRDRERLGAVDRRLHFSLRSGKPIYELGEPILVELQLSNVGDRPVVVHRSLDPSEGLVDISVTDPDGTRRSHVPIVRRCVRLEQQALEPGGTLPFASVNLTVGASGFPFKKPGTYRIGAIYTNLDGGIQTATMALRVRPPPDADVTSIVNELFDARVGWVLHVGGSRAMEDVNDKIDWVRDRLGMRNPISLHLATVRFMPLARSANLIVPGTLRRQTLGSKPDLVVEHLGRIVMEQPCAAAKAMGHVRFRQVVDTFARSAIEAGADCLALEAQKRLLGLLNAGDRPPLAVAAGEAQAAMLRRAQ